jgi:HD-like signal output (HDOD) protein
VKELYPSVVRLVLSGHAEVKSTLSVVNSAHQFLSKPCDGAVLKDVIERTCNLRSLLADPKIQRVVGAMSCLPSLPACFAPLTSAIENPEVSVAHLATIVQKDVALCAKILQIVNSSFFGVVRRVASIEQAISYLGTTLLKAIALTAEMFRWSEQDGRLAIFSPADLQRHSMLTARIAMRLMSEKTLAEDAFMAGLLHDTGTLVLARSEPEQFTEALTASKVQKRPLFVAEGEAIGVSHAEIGAYLLGLWGLPSTIVEAVALHHTPAHAGVQKMDVLGAVYVANILADEHTPSCAMGAGHSFEPIDPEYLEAMGVAERLSEWRNMAAKQAEALEG